MVDKDSALPKLFVRDESLELANEAGSGQFHLVDADACVWPVGLLDWLCVVPFCAPREFGSLFQPARGAHGDGAGRKATQKFALHRKAEKVREGTVAKSLMPHYEFCLKFLD